MTAVAPASPGLGAGTDTVGEPAGPPDPSVQLYAPAAGRIRTVPGPYDRSGGQVTVATPSCCCCCCCCCLITLTGGATFTATLAYRERVRSHGHGGAALAMLSMPLAVVAAVLASSTFDVSITIAVVAAAVFTGSFAWGLRMAGVEWPRAVGVSVLTGLVLGVSLVAEFLVALFTLMLVELATPFAIFAGYQFAKAMTPYDPPATWPPHPGWTPPGGMGPGWGGSDPPGSSPPGQAPPWPPSTGIVPGTTSLTPWEPRPPAPPHSPPTTPAPEPAGDDPDDPQDPSGPSPWARPDP